MNPTDGRTTIIVTTYNLGPRLAPCLDSLEPLRGDAGFHILFVDDRSTDGTLGRLSDFKAGFSNVEIVSLPENSGSPSRPRNVGIEAARTRFIFILDGDDALNVSNLKLAVVDALTANWEITRGYLEVVRGKGEAIPVDRLTGEIPAEKVPLVKKFVATQSVGSMALIERELVLASGVRFDESCRMGEDLRFMADLLVAAERVGYVDVPLFRYHKAHGGEESSTTMISNRVIREFAESWDYIQNAYSELDVDFLQLHGRGTVSYGVQQIVWHAESVSRDAFECLGAFARKYEAQLDAIDFLPRIREVLEACWADDYSRFLQSIKPRMLIAGHDLKFIRPAAQALSERYSLAWDEWPSERVHDAEKSKDLLEWAEIIWVEWMTAASVWYSHRVRRNQRLIVRAHFYEITRDSGFELKFENVSAVVAIALHTYEDIVARFGFPREKVRLIPNFYETAGYARSTDPDRKHRLAVVGIVPRRKGFARALEILEGLVAADPRYTLTVFGSSPDDLPWVASDPNEQRYYSACQNYVKSKGLGDHLTYAGWVDTREVLGDYGVVLSTSDFEGSHVAPGEAFCAGNLGIFLPWRGAEYVYPSENIEADTSAIVDRILSLDLQSEQSRQQVESTAAYLRDNQDTAVFVREVSDLVRSVAP